MYLSKSMTIQRNKLNIGKARRRVQMRSALLLTLGACLLTLFVRLLLTEDIPYALRWPVEMLTVLAAFGGSAYLGLFVLDGDHRKIVPLRKLSRGQTFHLAMLGVLAAAPVTLAHELVAALFGQRMMEGGAQAMNSMRFAAMIAKSVVAAPILEELFFRGYLLPAIVPQGRLRASAAVSLCFALTHTLDPAGLCAYVLLSLLLCWMALHTQSILAPVLVHAAYNLTLLALESLGLAGLFAGWSLFSCFVRLALCAAFVCVLKKAYTARPACGAFALWEGGKPGRREILMLACACLLLIATLIMGG